MRISLLLLGIAFAMHVLWWMLMFGLGEILLGEDRYGVGSVFWMIVLSALLFLFGVCLLVGSLLRRVSLVVSLAIVSGPLLQLLGLGIGGYFESVITVFVFWCLPIVSLLVAGWFELTSKR